MKESLDLRASILKSGGDKTPLLRSAFTKKLYLAAFFLLVAANAGTLLHAAAVSSETESLKALLLEQGQKNLHTKQAVETAREKMTTYAERQGFMQANVCFYEFLAAVSELEEDALLLHLNYRGKEVVLAGETADEQEIMAFAEKVGILVPVLRADAPEISVPVVPGAGVKRFSLRCYLR